jgi:transposase-like protein
MSATRNRFSPEFRHRAVRMVEEHRGDYSSEWATMRSNLAKVGCTAKTLRRWCREEAGRWAGHRRSRSATGIGSRRWNAKRRNCAALTRSCTKPLHILRRRSEPENFGATGNGEVVYRRSPGRTGYRTDLPGTGAHIVLAPLAPTTNMPLASPIPAGVRLVPAA